MSKKYLAYYETEWPANIAELTAVENKPFVGYLKGEGVQFTVIPEEIPQATPTRLVYTTTDNNRIDNWAIFGSEGIPEYTQYQNGAYWILETSEPFYFNVYSTDVWLTSDEKLRLKSVSYYSNNGYITGDYFINCKNLETFTVIGSDYITLDVGQDHFYGCSKLCYIPKIGETVIQLGALSNCSSLQSVTICSSVTKFQSECFAGSALNQIIFEGTTAQWNAITKSEDWNSGCPEITVHCTDGDIIIPAN